MTKNGVFTYEKEIPWDTSLSPSEQELYISHHNGDFYQSPPRRTQRPREHHTREPRIDLPPFYGKDDIKEYLEWEMKVEQLFECHHTNDERKVSMATLSFQGHAMY